MATDITVEFATEGVRRAVRQFERVREKLEDIGITGERVARLGRAMRRGVTRAARGLAIGLGAAATAAGLLARSAVSVASKLEQARIKFDALFGSAREGQQAIRGLRDLAAQVPVTFENLLESAQGLASVVEGPREMIRRLRQLVELSARFPINLREATSNFIRFWQAGAGAADLFREAGINAALGVQAGMETTVEESRKMWEQFFHGIQQSGQSATDRLATSFQGIVSMIQDAWFRLRAQIAEAGLFEAVKNSLDGLRESIDEFIESGQAQAFAREFTNALSMMVGAIQGLVNVAVQADDFVRDTFLGRVMGLERGPAGKAAEAEERLQTLQDLQSQLEGGTSLGNLLPRARQAGLSFIEPSDASKRREAFEAQLAVAIGRQEQRVDSLTDRFLEADSLLRSFNDALDEAQRRLRGGGTPAGGGAGAGARGQRGPTLEDVLPGLGRMAGPQMMGVGRIGPQLDLEEMGVTADDLRESWNAATDAGKRQAEVTSQMAGSVISTVSAMAQTVASGFQNIADIIINTVSSILSTLSRQGGPLSGFLGGLAGPIFGGVAGLISAVAGGGGSNRPQPVEVKNREPIEVEEQQPRGPESVVLQVISPSGDRLGELEYQLRRRSRRDAAARVPGEVFLAGAAG